MEGIEVYEEAKPKETLFQKTKLKIKNICGSVIKGTKSVFNYIKLKIFKKKETDQTI